MSELSIDLLEQMRLTDDDAENDCRQDQIPGADPFDDDNYDLTPERLHDLEDYEEDDEEEAGSTRRPKRADESDSR